MPLFAEPPINHRLMTLATNYLHTLDSSYFPFTANFTDEQRQAFVRDLRIGLSDYTESGSKRGTAGVGYIVSDKRLRSIVQGWEEAEGGWPKSHDATNPDGVVSIAGSEPR